MRRRSFVAKSIATVLGGAGLTSASRSLMAQEAPLPPCPPGQTRTGKGDCVCPAGTDPCPAGCFDLKRDPLNCGRCGRVCPAGTSCRKGKCRA